jgi:hypothetical protein
VTEPVGPERHGFEEGLERHGLAEDGLERDSGRDGSQQDGVAPDSLAPDGLGQHLEQNGLELDGLDFGRGSQGEQESEPELHGSDADAKAPGVSSGVEASGDASRLGDGSRPDDDLARTEPDAGDPARTEPVADDPEAANEHVAAALAELDAAADWPPSDQVAAFTAAHETLQATLARIDDH